MAFVRLALGWLGAGCWAWGAVLHGARESSPWARNCLPAHVCMRPVLCTLHRLLQVLLLLRGQQYLDVLRAQRSGQQYQQQYKHYQQPVCNGAATAAASVCPMGAAGPEILAEAAAVASVGAAGQRGRPPAGVPGTVWESLPARSARRVFGDRHPLLWLLPLEPEPETPAAVGKKRS